MSQRLARSLSQLIAPCIASGFREYRVSLPTFEEETRPAAANSERCRATACRLIGSRPANSVAVPSGSADSHSTSCRRVGSASATKTAVGFGSDCSNGVKVFDQIGELRIPSTGVGVEPLLI